MTDVRLLKDVIGLGFAGDTVTATDAEAAYLVRTGRAVFARKQQLPANKAARPRQDK